MARVEVLRAIAPIAMSLRPDEVKAIRYKLNQSQSEFALMIGVSIATLQGWEEGRHRPDGPAQALLRVCAKNPKMVAKALGNDGN